MISSKTCSSISVFAENNTSPVSVLNISLDKTLPNRNSSERDIWDAFELVNSLICLAVILFPASTYTLLLTLISTGNVSPLNLSGTNSTFTESLSRVNNSSS